MRLPDLTLDQIRQRCTEQSFTRGTEYFHTGAIGNPVFHGYTLSATCHGTDVHPYRVSVELMPTGIATTSCSCPYGGDSGGYGDCKHIVALLLTYVHTPDIIASIDTLINTLSEKPKDSLLRILSEVLRRTPELAPVVQVYADGCDDTETVPTVLTVYLERIDHIFGPGFLEQHQLHAVLSQLDGLVEQAESLSELGETEFALSILHALIHQSIVRYPDTLQKQELPRFVKKCTTTFAQIAMDLQELTATGLSIEVMPVPLLEHYQMLLALSFDAAPVFTSLLTHLLQQCCAIQESADLQATIEQRLDESPDRQAHIQLLFTFYFQSGRIGDCLRLARRERENYLLIDTLFTHQQDAAAWRALETHVLSVDEYWNLLKSPIATRVPQFTDKLLSVLRCHHPHIAITVYQRCVEALVLSRRRENYEKVRGSLATLKRLHHALAQSDVWTVYLGKFRERHARKHLLLQIIADL